MNKIIRHILTIIFISLSTLSYANRPHIINIDRNDYNAANKNWAISQDERGFMYFGNDTGLLEFDGIEWNLNPLPNTLIVRSVFALNHHTIFTGSYNEFGRWDRDISGKLVYTSLSNKIDKTLFKNDDFWKIWATEDKVYFQSFTSIYTYDFKTVKRISANHGFLFLSKVRDEFLVQQMGGPLYRLKDNDSLELIEGSEIFKDTDVRVILPYAKNNYLIGTSTKGMFIYDGKGFKEWGSEVSQILANKELNCGILTSNGYYFLGTILDGIYITDSSGNIINNISTKESLQNNTILSLYEDNSNNVWAGLDRGVSYIQHISNMSTYIDKTGKIGAVYDAAIWNNNLYIGTNQGVFYIPTNKLTSPDTFSKMKLIEGTQGQVWSLKIIDNTLYCCHNKGLKEIGKDQKASDVYNIGTGVYNITEASIKEQSFKILSTYSSLRIINKETNRVEISKQISEPITNTIVDHLGNIWLEHFIRGVYRCRMNEKASDFQNITYYGGNGGDNLPFKLKIFKVGGRVILLGNDHFYAYDDIKDNIISDNLLNECFRGIKNIKQVIQIKDNIFWALTNSAIYKFSFDGYKASILESYSLGMNLSLVNSYENISILNDSINLVCLDNGFLLYNSNISKISPHNKDKTLPIPHIESLQAINIKQRDNYKSITNIAEIPYSYNSVRFRFSSNKVFPLNLAFQYMLEHVDKEWSSPRKINTIIYERLPEGEYNFKLRTVDEFGNTSDISSFSFSILPPWYQTWWAYLMYILIIVAILYGIWMLILRQYRNIHLQKIRSRETKRLRILTGQLRQEINDKNAELVTQTSFIIQKNELLLKLREMVNDFYRQNTNKSIAPLHRKINTLLNKVDTKEDWKTFLIKFEQKHTNFFKTIKTLYPQLTNQDLRLCACLKLNLDTKETASLMNLSVRAIENNRYRLRKKLNLQPSDNLYDFFINIE